MLSKFLNFVGVVLSLSYSAVAMSASELTPVTVLTNWYAQAEQGGLYAAKALGIYEKYGLDVTIQMGGPQVNNVQLLVGGKVDFSLGYGLQSLSAVREEVPLVSVAAWFQKDPQSMVVHEGVGNDSLEALKGKGIRVPAAGRISYWPWMKSLYGFSDSQLRPYEYTYGPFIIDPEAIMQGYVTIDGFFLAKENVKAKSLLLADYGWNAYSATMDTTRGMINKHPEIVQAMVEATAKGWAEYFADPEPANALIKEDNPEMQDALLAYSYARMQEEGILLSGAAKDGRYGMMTKERWQEFYEDMVAAGTLPEGLDWEKAFDLSFIEAVYND
ncbi:ABC transporter substrate-binding protein [Marinobacter sp. F3R11]|nr:ABC transporter substrate-binding protein [Marinobacter sp. F3R11]